MCVGPLGRVRLDVDALGGADEDHLQPHVEVAALVVRQGQFVLVGYLAAEGTPGRVVGDGNYKHLVAPVDDGTTDAWAAGAIDGPSASLLE